jgi:hypothetical protein
MTKRWLVAVCVLVGCSSKPSRPAAITSEMAETYDKYVSTLESFANDLGAPQMTCGKAFGVVKDHAADIASLVAFNGTTIKETLAVGAKDAAARTWLADSYGSRLSSSAGKLATVAVLCKDEVAFKIALASMMSKFPMLENK